MALRLPRLFRRHLSSAFLRDTAAAALHTHSLPPAPIPHPLRLLSDRPASPLLRALSTAARRGGPAVRGKAAVDIGARARQLQTRRLWTYALTFGGVAGFIIVVLANFQDALVFYITPSEALEKFAANPDKNRFRLGGLVLEGSVSQPAGTPEMEFVITDLLTDILVRYEGSLPDLFREGHSVVVEGFLRPFEGGEDGGDPRVVGDVAPPKVTEKARTGDCFFKAVEVLAKHDEKYMPKEVGEALERNRKKIQEEGGPEAAAAAAALEAAAAKHSRN